MKKILLTLLLTSLTLLTAKADLIWYEGFNYADGLLTNNSAGVWQLHSTSGANDLYVRNHRLEISGNTSTNAPRQADGNRWFCTSSCTYTSSVQIIYGSFTVNCTNLPVTGATNYFAHLQTSGGTGNNVGGNQQPRIFGAVGTLPGTWRLGISGNAALPNKIYPVDLAPNVDYQVVFMWDPVTTFAGTLWVNPIDSSSLSVVTSDTVTTPLSSKSMAFRQASGTTSFFVAVSNCAVATTFPEAATNVWATNATAPIIVNYSGSGTNFTGTATPVLFSGIAAGQGLGSLTYTWLKNGSIYTNPNGNTNTLVTPATSSADNGAYQLVATTPYGLSVTSAVANLWVTNAPIPPTISSITGNTNVYVHNTATVHVAASGPPTLTYTWTYNSGPLGANVSGDGTDTISITDVQSANGTTGTYTCTVGNPYGSVSTSATVSVLVPPAVSIAYLRTLVDPTTFNATNATLRYQTTGVVTTSTNLTSGTTSSYYIQDGTGGINVFITGTTTFRPSQGDVVTFVGFLSSFNSNLELGGDTTDLSTSWTVLSNNVALLPAPRPIPFSITNNLSLMETNVEGSIVMLTNVYFGTNAGVTIASGANSTATVTNANGETFILAFSSQDTDTGGQTLPAFAYTVVGPLVQNLNNATTPRNQGYTLTVTRFSDIVTNPLSLAISRSGTASGGTNSLSWSAAPYSYSYTVLAATNVVGPYSAEYQQFQAILSGANEAPTPNSSTAGGYGTVVLSPDQTTITVNLNFTGLTGGNAGAGHIHGPAAAGATAGVLFPFSGVPAATSGAIPTQSFSITPTQVGYLRSGLLYMNIHDSTYPGGEIRGQLYPVPLRFTDTNGTYDDAPLNGDQKFYKLSTP